MNAFTTAVVSYVITGLISFFVAGLIQLMVMVMKRLPKTTVAANHSSSPVESEADRDAEIAAVIAIAKQAAL